MKIAGRWRILVNGMLRNPRPFENLIRWKRMTKKLAKDGYVTFGLFGNLKINTVLKKLKDT